MAEIYHFLPYPPLSLYIEDFCVYQGEPGIGVKERCLPDGRLALIINLGHERFQIADPQHSYQFQDFYGGILQGAFSKFAIIDTTTMVTTISVNFKAGGVSPFLPIPVAELTNQIVELPQIWGRDALYLREQLQMAAVPRKQIDLLQQFLLKQLKWERIAHPAVAFAVTAFQAGPQRPTIADMGTRVGLSPRHFIRVFEEAMGLSPKVFCRVLRFQEVLQLLKNNSHMRWLDIALMCGYFDQAHFIHDFQAFAEMTPGAYIAQRGEYHNHVPLVD